MERTSHVKVGQKVRCCVSTDIQVYISWALLEIAVLGGGEDEDGNEIEGEEGDPNAAREVFERGYKELRRRGEKEDVSNGLELVRSPADEQRALLLEAWKTFEEQHGTEEDLARVQEMMPTTRKRWRKAEDGSGQLEECEWIVVVPLDIADTPDWDLAFPDDERDANPASYKFFKAAQEWAAQRGQEAGAVAAPTTGFGGLSYEMDSESESDDDDDDDEEDDAEEAKPVDVAGNDAAATGGDAMDED